MAFGSECQEEERTNCDFQTRQYATYEHMTNDLTTHTLPHITTKQSDMHSEIQNLRSDMGRVRDEVWNERGDNNKTNTDGSEKNIQSNNNSTKSNTGIRSGFICVSKKKQTCEATKTEIKNKLKKYNDIVNGLRNLNDGAILIECNNKESVKSMQADANETMGEYEIKEIQRRRPKLKIVNISETFNSNELISQIIEQNAFVKLDDDIVVIKIIEKRPNKFKEIYHTAIIEVNGDLFNRIMDAGHLAIGWERCKVYESVSVQRCYKCLGFNHRSSECKNVMACAKCAGHHHYNECRANTQKCINCLKAAKNVRIDLNTNHGAYDEKCYVYQRQIERKRNRIDYGA